MKYAIEPLSPFGAVIRNEGMESVDEFTPEEIIAWIRAYKLLVFRGFAIMPRQRFALFGQKLGKPLQWVFGAINDLKVKPDAGNYIFTDHDVPMHWDGAFVGRIPYIILFQCIIAPKKEDMGGTTFADTRQMLQDASAADKNEWEKISVTYTTRKVVHYGGQITQKFIAPHEVDGYTVIRYAEPVDDINPVALDIHGIPLPEHAPFIAHTKDLLYSPKYLYTHRWEAGDIVMADNHTLLHGREAFRNPNERYIQRINILYRPQRITIRRFIDNCLTIRRKEFFVAELPIFLIPVLLNIGTPAAFLNPMLYLGLLAIIMFFNIGDMINCYADYELDSIYKSHLSNAVYELGKRNVRLQIILSGILGLALTTFISGRMNEWYLLFMTLAGVFVGLEYSVPPFQFKSRGLWQLLCLWGIIFFGPMFYTAVITGGFPGMLQLALFAAYGFHQMGIIMLNTAEDYTEDKASGLNTIIVNLGLHRAMNFAFWLVVGSGLAIQAMLAALAYKAGYPWYLYPFIGIFTAGWLVILKEYYVIISKINSLEEDKAISEIKKNGMKVPRWLKIGAYASLAVVLVYFVYNCFLANRHGL